MKKKMHIYAAAMAAVLMAVMFAGCAKDYTEAAPKASETTVPVIETVEDNTVPTSDTPAVTEPEGTEGTEPADVDSSDSTFQWPKLDKEAAQNARKTGNGSKDNGSSDAATETGSGFGSVESIAALGGLKATVQEDEDECLVYIFDETKNHGNPYDVTWDYGKDYDAYVAAVNWSLVFDAEYYKSAFPMLAVLYHNDDALLLRHFQTIGIHEGRQASKNFNVAAYMDNCDKSLRKAFGDDYECYYLYYLLHQDTESGVKATGSYKKQLAQELTVTQTKELKGVNGWREEVNAGTVEFDSEMAALANYRAYMDCTEGWNDHDGLEHMLDTREFYKYMDMIDMDKYQENKDTNGCYAGRERTFDAAADYRSSQGHYETMVNPEYTYVGCSHFYVSDVDYDWSGKFDNNVITLDVYADTVTTAYHTK